MSDVERDEIVLSIIGGAAKLLAEKDGVAATIAAQFCAMTDDGQAQFFVHVARIMGEWGASNMDSQLYEIGQHLVRAS